MQAPLHNISGLTDEQVLAARTLHGTNALRFKKQPRLLKILKSIFGEPMVILLFAASAIYFFSGQVVDAVMLFSAIIIISIIGINLYPLH